jgi:hypothetical protein
MRPVLPELKIILGICSCGNFFGCSSKLLLRTLQAQDLSRADVKIAPREALIAVVSDSS